MLFGGNSQQYSGGNNQTVNQNTTFFKGYSEDSAIEVSGWNDKIGIQLRPFAGKNSSGMNTYERERTKTIITALTLDACATLIDGIESEIIPAIKGNVPGKVSIPLNDNSSTGSKKIFSVIYNPESGVVIEIACNVGEDYKVIPQYVQTYTCKNRNYLKDYNGETGSYENVGRVSEAEVLYNILKSYTNLIPMAYHAQKYSKSREYHPAPQQTGAQPAYQQNMQHQYAQPAPQQAPMTQGGSFSEQELPF